MPLSELIRCNPRTLCPIRAFVGRAILVAATTLLLETRGARASDQAASAASWSPDRAREFVARVVGDTEDVWGALFLASGKSTYPEPKVVLFHGLVRSGCGLATTAAGPFYCPADRNVYLDTTFFESYARFGDAGDFARAYLIVREISHHVQNVLGTTQKYGRSVSGTDEQQPKQLRIRLELQADCYVGVWAHSVQRRSLLEPADLEKGLPAAIKVGSAATHGTPIQRTTWFERGLGTGDFGQCDTFATAQP